MKKLIHLIIFLTFFCIFMPFPARAFEYVLGSGTYTRQSDFKPERMTNYIEPNFHTTIKRVTDAVADGLSEYKCDSGAYICQAPDYCKHTIENADGTYVLVSANEWRYFLYNRVTGAFIKAIDFKKLGFSYSYDAGGIEPRWDANDPSVFYYVLPGTGSISDCPAGCRATFNKYNVDTDTRTVLHDFTIEYPGATQILTATEGEPSKDSRIWAWFVKHPGNQSGRTTIVIYDKDFYSKDNGKIIKTWNNTAYTGNFISVSPYGNYIMVPNYKAQSPCWNSLFPVADFPNTEYCIGGGEHCDWVLDPEGNEAYFYKIPGDKIGFIKLSDRIEKAIVPIVGGGSPWHLVGLHHSGHSYDKPGWGIISTYNPNGGWMDNQIFAVEIKENGRIWRLADTQITTPYPGYYFKQAWATINKAGTRIYWGTDWRSGNSGTVDTYVIELPSSWYQDLSVEGNIPPHQGVGYFHQASYSSIGTNSNYSFVITSNTSQNRSDVQTRKNSNSTIKALYYKDSLTHGTSYPYIDQNGKRCINKNWGWELKDISNSSYRTSLANDINSSLSSYTVFDGVFLDDVWYSVTPSDFYEEGTSPRVDCSMSSTFVNNWKTNMASILSAVKSAIGSKLLISNGGIFEPTYISQVDGCMDENFAHPNWSDENTHQSQSTWLSHLGAVDTLIGSNKYFIAQSGVSDGASEAGESRLVRYSLASYLMKVPSGGSQYYTHYFIPSMTYSNDYWRTEWQSVANLGNPKSAFALIPGESYAYRRNFENGVVLVNIGDTTSSSINIGWTTVTVPPHDGAIYINSIPALLGDLNADGQVNIFDIQLTANVAVGTETNPAIVSRADVNGDGQRNIFDIQAVANLAVGG